MFGGSELRKGQIESLWSVYDCLIDDLFVNAGLVVEKWEMRRSGRRGSELGTKLNGKKILCIMTLSWLCSLRTRCILQPFLQQNLLYFVWDRGGGGEQMGRRSLNREQIDSERELGDELTTELGGQPLPPIEPKEKKDIVKS